jgi:hypothetical protein
VKKIRAILFLLLLSLAGCVTVAYYRQLDDATAGMNADGTRFIVNGIINNKPATLALDTGAGADLVLFRPSAERLGLSFSDVPMALGRPDGMTPSELTKPYRVTAFDITGKMSFAIIDIPISVDAIDGIVGWPLLRDNILQIDADRQALKSLDEVPQEARAWTSLRLRRKSSYLTLEIPGPHGEGGILIDTGSAGGVSLNPERWQAWTNAHPNRPKTLAASYSPGSGMVIGEESWSQRFSLGPLTLTDVPVTQADRSDIALGSPGYQATLGIAALRRLELVVDGKKGVVYLRPQNGRSRPYPYNRAGVVFAPRSLQGSGTNSLIAHVIEGSPAYDAGIQNGDMLVKINQQWSTNRPQLSTHLFRTLPAGTRIDLTLKRGEGTVNTTVVLRDIFPSSAVPAKEE